MTRASLFDYIALASVRPITEKDRKPLQRFSFDPQELKELKEMKTNELRGLMCFCGIRTFEELPVIACDDDELRMAYIVWRSYYSKEKRLVLNKKVNRFEKYMDLLSNELDDFMDRY
jgi:hypothetical protein